MVVSTTVKLAGCLARVGRGLLNDVNERRLCKPGSGSDTTDELARRADIDAEAYLRLGASDPTALRLLTTDAILRPADTLGTDLAYLLVPRLGRLTS